jgi:outer membrane protein OmpA-like peptidoglycan-associated protein
MLRFFLAAIAIFISLAGRSQRTAAVNVLITDMTGKAAPGERVYFNSLDGGHLYNAVTDAAGLAHLDLPNGESYVIRMKNVTDTGRHGLLTIPLLTDDQAFSKPYEINIRFKGTKNYILKNVLFESGKTSLKPESFPALDELFSTLQAASGSRIEIGGHTDSRGRDSINLRISQQRADIIKSYLVKKGISADRITARGFGASEPVATNETEEGRQANRRTEVRFY